LQKYLGSQFVVGDIAATQSLSIQALNLWKLTPPGIEVVTNISVCKVEDLCGTTLHTKPTGIPGMTPSSFRV